MIDGCRLLLNRGKVKVKWVSCRLRKSPRSPSPGEMDPRTRTSHHAESESKSETYPNRGMATTPSNPLYRARTRNKLEPTHTIPGKVWERMPAQKEILKGGTPSVRRPTSVVVLLLTLSMRNMFHNVQKCVVSCAVLCGVRLDKRRRETPRVPLVGFALATISLRAWRTTSCSGPLGSRAVLP